MNILAVLQAEIDAVTVTQLSRTTRNPSVAYSYSKLPDVDAKLELITLGRSGIPWLPWAGADQLGPL